MDGDPTLLSKHIRTQSLHNVLMTYMYVCGISVDVILKLVLSLPCRYHSDDVSCRVWLHSNVYHLRDVQARVQGNKTAQFLQEYDCCG